MNRNTKDVLTTGIAGIIIVGFIAICVGVFIRVIRLIAGF